MRKNPIKVLLLLLLSLGVSASTYEWSATSSKERAYTNEAIYLKYVCTFSDRAELFSVDFNPVISNDRYTIKMLSETTKIKNYKKILTYEFVAFVHKSGVQEFEFEMNMKETNQDSIENTVIGRDNGKYAEYVEHRIKQKKLLVDVRDAKTPIVGEFAMKVKHGDGLVKALTPYNLEIELSGVGNFDAIQTAKFEIEGIKVFSQEPSKSIKLTKEGYRGVWSQKFAFVGERDFTIPSFSLEYLYLKSKRVKKLHFDGMQVRVKEGYKREELLDAPENTFNIDYSYIYYVLTFILGFLVSKIEFKKVKKVDSKDELFRQKIENAKTIDEILFILALQNSVKYREIIQQIEKRELSSLQEVKKLI